MFEGYADHYDEETRLIILKALCDEPNYSLTDSMLETVLMTFAVTRGREYVRNQLYWLRDTAGAVKLVKAGSAIIAEALKPAVDHVNCKRKLEGIKEPSRPTSARGY